MRECATIKTKPRQEGCNEKVRGSSERKRKETQHIPSGEVLCCAWWQGQHQLEIESFLRRIGSEDKDTGASIIHSCVK